MQNIALIGCGLWGRNILRVLQALEVRVVVIDTDGDRRNEAVAHGAVGAFDSLDQRTPDVDGIIVATPATTHANVLTEVLALHKPVFVEKPFTTDVASAERLARAGAEKLFVMDIWRHHPAIRILAEMVSSGELGPVELLRSSRTNWTSPRKDTDAIWTLLPHDIAIALEVLGQIPTARFATAERCGNKIVGALVVLGDSPQVIIEVSTRYADKRREVRLHCRDGVAVLNVGTGSPIQIFRERKGQPDVSTRPFDQEEPLKIELQAFLHYLNGGPPPKSSAEDSVKIVRSISEIRQLAGIR